MRPSDSAEAYSLDLSRLQVPSSSSSSQVSHPFQALPRASTAVSISNDGTATASVMSLPGFSPSLSSDDLPQHSGSLAEAIHRFPVPEPERSEIDVNRREAGLLAAILRRPQVPRSNSASFLDGFCEVHEAIPSIPSFTLRPLRQDPASIQSYQLQLRRAINNCLHMLELSVEHASFFSQVLTGSTDHTAESNLVTTTLSTTLSAFCVLERNYDLRLSIVAASVLLCTRICQQQPLPQKLERLLQKNAGQQVTKALLESTAVLHQWPSIPLLDNMEMPLTALVINRLSEGASESDILFVLIVFHADPCHVILDSPPGLEAKEADPELTSQSRSVEALLSMAGGIATSSARIGR